MNKNMMPFKAMTCIVFREPFGNINGTMITDYYQLKKTLKYLI